MNNILSKTECLNGTVLKIIALVSMTIDHIGFILFPDLQILRIMGRLAFPIFAYMIAEGCFYTKNKRKYLFMIVFIGVLCQVVAFVAQRTLEMNIMFTLAFAVVVIFVMQWAFGRRKIFPSSDKNRISGGKRGAKESIKAYRVLVLVLVILAVIFVTTGLPKIIFGFSTDYRVFGAFLPVVVYLGRNRFEKLCIMAVWLIFLSLSIGGVQWYGLLTLVPLAFYNGQRGKHSLKYLFYIYYPVHLGILWGIYFL